MFAEKYFVRGCQVGLRTVVFVGDYSCVLVSHCLVENAGVGNVGLYAFDREWWHLIVTSCVLVFGEVCWCLEDVWVWWRMLVFGENVGVWRIMVMFGECWCLVRYIGV